MVTPLRNVQRSTTESRLITVKRKDHAMSEVRLGIDVACRADPEPVKQFETRSYDAFCMTSSLGSLIQATVGSFGGSGRRPPNLVGFAA